MRRVTIRLGRIVNSLFGRKLEANERAAFCLAATMGFLRLP